MASKDWIPTREQDLVDFCGKWLLTLENEATASAFKWNTSERAVVLGKIRAFLDARTAHEADNSSSNRMKKDEAKKEAVDAMRDFANTSIRFNKNMDDAARTNLGIRPKDSTPTRHERPASQPNAVVENTRNRFEHVVKALNREIGGMKKPDDAYGIKYAWQLGGEKPASAEDLTKSHFSRKTNHTVSYTEADKGKPAYYACRYENGKGEGGPWSPIVEAFIG